MVTPPPLSVSTPGSTPGSAQGDAVPIRLGTRASALATTQSGLVARRLEELTGRPVELVRIRTEGDVRTGSLASLGGTGVFVTALREALLDGRCDVAVHSLKDLPTTPAPDLTFVTPEREDPRDALCARDGLTLATLPRGGRVGTGSPRRAAQIRAARPDLDVVDIRGNVGTRLDRALGPDADLDAVVLAYAGLARLGRTEVISEVLDVDVVAPAPGQGALAVEVRTADIVSDPSTGSGRRGRAAPRVPDLAEAMHLSTTVRPASLSSPSVRCWRGWRPAARPRSVRTPGCRAPSSSCGPWWPPSTVRSRCRAGGRRCSPRTSRPRPSTTPPARWAPPSPRTCWPTAPSGSRR
jgi:hydroxymethylbilane synthase